MKSCVLLLLAFVCVYGGLSGVLPQSSCKDPATMEVAGQALEKINLDRDDGYIFSLERVSDVHQTRHGESGVVYCLKIDVLETTCHVFSKKNWKECETRGIGEHPVYGQCKAAVYVNKPQRVLRLYKYSCDRRPVAASKIIATCPDCPLMIALDDKEIVQTMKMGLEKFNNESTHANYFAPLEITSATMQGGIATFYNVEFTIQETVCTNANNVADVSKCSIMTCEFAHKGFCKASRSRSWNGQEHLRVNCEIYEPQAAEEEKQKQSLAAKLDHHQENIGDSAHDHHHLHDKTKKRHPEGSVHVYPSLDKPSTLPMYPDPQIPGKGEAVIDCAPAPISPNCPGEFKTNLLIIKESFAQDPLFNIKPPAL